MSSACQPAIPFMLAPALSRIPEDILVHILSFVSLLDVLAIRRCCRRLYRISLARVVWIRALREAYSFRGLPPCHPSSITQLHRSHIEHRVTRPLRFLHALADMGSAFCEDTVIALGEDITPMSTDEMHWSSSVVGLHIIPGGRWLCLLVNCKGEEEHTHQGLLIILDLWRDTIVLRHRFADTAYWSDMRSNDAGSDIMVIAGFDRGETDPYIAAFRVAVSQLEADGADVHRMGTICLNRTPQSCSIFGSVVASADRTGSVTFWDWKKGTAATMTIDGWLADAEIALLSNTYFASFAPTSSTLIVHNVPPLLRLFDNADSGVDDDEPAGGEEEETEPLVSYAPPSVSNASEGVKRFRLPSRNLELTFPERIPASSFYHDNAQFPEPFLAYFVASHPESSSDIHLGLIPDISLKNELTEHEEHSQSQQLHGQPLGPANNAAGLHVGHPPNLGPAEIPSVPDAEWLPTLRCVDTSSGDALRSEGSILWCSSLDHSIAVLRVQRGCWLEIFTTSALHAKTEVVPPGSVEALASIAPITMPPLPPSATVNPHSRFERHVEGDYQVLQYRLYGDIGAATVDEVSGKIALVVRSEGRISLVTLDYGWNFWKPEENEEMEWRA